MRVFEMDREDVTLMVECVTLELEDPLESSCCWK